MRREPSDEEIRGIGEAIAKVRRYRRISGQDLKDSREFVERLTVELRTTNPEKFTSPSPMQPLPPRYLPWLLIYIGVLVWSLIKPHDYPTWLLESLPALVAVVVLLFTYKRFQFTTLAYWLILAHCIILFVGGHYTYAEVPLFEHAKQWFGWSRNNYDKLGHFAQGFVPAIVAREVLIRKGVFANAGWRNFFIVCFCLAVSATYEMVEWLVAITSKDAAEAFLGTQGYVWDTQSDMASALIGAVVALVVLGSLHDRQLEEVAVAAKAG
jgi:putative membrane protein